MEVTVKVCKHPRLTAFFNFLYWFICISLAIAIALVSIYLYNCFTGVYNNQNTIILDTSSMAKTFDSYVSEKNNIFSKRYNTFFSDEQKLYPQYYVDSVVFNQFINLDESDVANFKSDYMSVDTDYELVNIAPSEGTVKNIDCEYKNSDTLMEDLGVRYGQSISFDLDKNLLYSLVHKDISLSNDELELYLNDDGVSEAQTDKYRIVFRDLKVSGLYTIPQLNYKSSILFDRENVEAITSTELDEKFGGVLVSLNFDCKQKYFEGILFGVGDIDIYDKDSNVLLLKLNVIGDSSRLLSMINPFERFDYQNLRKYGLN